MSCDKNQICFKCVRARKTWSDELIEKGYFGCNLFIDESIGENNVILHLDAEIIGTGWVDLNSRPDGKGSGHLYNFQLIVKNVKWCKKFMELK